MIILPIASVLLIVFILSFVFHRKRKREQENPLIPEGVITPVEALMLDKKQKSCLKNTLKQINETLIKEINGYTRSHTIKFKFTDDFTKESIYEVERLYKQAGWKAEINKGYYHDSEWSVEFTIPEDLKMPKQLTNIRVDVVIETEKEPTLKELGIDVLEEKFKVLERNSNKHEK